MYEVLMYDGGVYRSDELFEIIEDVGGVVLQKNRSAQMLTVTMSVPEEDHAAIEAVSLDIGGQIRRSRWPGWRSQSSGPRWGATTCRIPYATSRRSSGATAPSQW